MSPLIQQHSIFSSINIIIITVLLFSTLIKIANARSAHCTIMPDNQDSNLTGRITFDQASPADPTIIYVMVSGLEPASIHGIHIHDFQSPANGCAAAGNHYNPTYMNHGAPGNASRHIGDMGNIVADEEGYATLSYSDYNISLFEGYFFIVGRICVIHELEDDLGQKGDENSLLNGNSGNKLGCGIIYRDNLVTRVIDYDYSFLIDWILPAILAWICLGALFYYFIYRKQNFSYEKLNASVTK